LAARRLGRAPHDSPSTRPRPARERALGGTALLLLALETAGRTPSAALLRGDELLAVERGREGSSGAEALLPCIDAVLGAAGAALADVEAFAVAVGPGSFTGLRIGVSTVKGLAFGDGRPVAAVPTLAAVAMTAPPGQGPAVTLLDARRGELYAAVFALDDGLPRALEPAEGVYTPEQLAPHLPARCVLVGDGVPLCADVLRERVGPELRVGPSADAGAEAVGRLGLRQLASGDATTAERLAPRYIRRAQAEVQRTGQAFE
jgi:tRNA threonylcarbamoyladenosine biosynthesis protein TsaB